MSTFICVISLVLAELRRLSSALGQLVSPERCAMGRWSGSREGIKLPGGLRDNDRKQDMAIRTLAALALSVGLLSAFPLKAQSASPEEARRHATAPPGGNIFTPVDRADPPVIDPPLRGGRWGAYNAPANNSIHRRGFAPVDGRVSIGERFATDWAKVEPSGEVYKGDATLNASYPGYGAKVYAVADGVVTQARDGTPDNQPGKSPSSYATADDLAGNHIIQRIGPRQFALYAHLQMGSLRVRPGGKVRRGQVIGLLGNSGNSTGPHLHFHVCDADSAMGCEGVPFAFRSFVTEGHNLWTGPTTEWEVARHLEIPLADTIVRFGP
jgi:hypothetical protein